MAGYFLFQTALIYIYQKHFIIFLIYDKQMKKSHFKDFLCFNQSQLFKGSLADFVEVKMTHVVGSL